MGWSDWQTYGDKTWLLSESSLIRRSGELSIGIIQTATDSDVGAALESMREVAAGFTDGGDPTPFTFDDSFRLVRAGYNIDTIKSNSDVLGVSVLESDAEVTSEWQTTVIYDANPLDGATDDFPPLLDTLTFGVDYDYIPGTFDFVEYESDVTPFVGWLDADVDVYAYTVGFQTEITAGAETDADLTIPDFNVNAYWFDLPATLNWPAFAPGTSLAPITLTGLTPTGLHGTPLIYPGQTFTLSDIPDMAFALALQTDFLGVDTFPLGDTTMPGFDAGFSNSIKQALAVNAYIGGDAFTSPGGLGAVGVVFTLPRFRYWIPDNIYTVGGHWADPNGVQVFRLKDDGVTWIPIVDGLAPPLA